MSLQIVNVIAFKATWFSMRDFVNAPIIDKDEKTVLLRYLEFQKVQTLKDFGTQYFSDQKLL